MHSFLLRLFQWDSEKSVKSIPVGNPAPCPCISNCKETHKSLWFCPTFWHKAWWHSMWICALSCSGHPDFSGSKTWKESQDFGFVTIRVYKASHCWWSRCHWPPNGTHQTGSNTLQLSGRGRVHGPAFWGCQPKVFTDSSFCSAISLQREKVGRGGAWSPPHSAVAHFHSFSLNVSCSVFKSNFSASFLSSLKLL